MLNEAKARSKIYTRTFPNSVAFYATKSGPPIAIVVEDGDHYYGVMAKSGFKKTYRALMMANIYEEPTDDELSLLDAMKHYNTGRDFDYEQFGDVFEVHPFDFNGMYKFLMNKVGVPLNVMVSRYGPLPDFDDNEIYRGVTIIPSTNMSKNSWALVKELIDKLTDTMHKFGFSHLIEGRLRIAKLSSGVAATYQYNSQIMTISLPMLRKPEGIRMLIHEMGHKWDDLSNLDQAIAKKYIEVKEKGHDYDFRCPPEIGEGFRISKTASKKYSQYVFKVVGSSHKGLMASMGNGTITIPFDMITNGNTLLDLDGNPLDITSNDPWFPTKYSASSHKEFFAELFMFWIFGEASEEASTWISSLPRT